MLVLSRADVEALLDPGSLIDALAPAMQALSEGRTNIPPRVMSMVEERGGLLAAMPGWVPSTLGAKLVAVYPGNAAKDIASHQAIVAVFDPDTGVPAAVMDGASVTAIRTACGAALATRLLAREDASVLTVVGTGVQARSHLVAVPLVRPVTEIRVAGRDPGKAQALAEAFGGRGYAVDGEAFAGADIVCACTHADEPVIVRRWLDPGVHVTSVGFTPGREVDEETVADAAVFVESRAAALGAYPGGANELADADPAAVAEIGELVAGTRPGRTANDQITLYKSVGVAVQDLVAAQLVLDEARRRGVGTEVAI